ncbi:caspase domain-containing protein [Streptomyces sp. NPDC001848]|uniref:caspase family protein n=1 Tax=Streptomyces sp. NPDC001848 TaxID=3364618 RepID=UPI0036A666BD
MEWIDDRRQTLGLGRRARRNTGSSSAPSSGARIAPPPHATTSEPIAPLECWTTGGAVLVGVGNYEYLPNVPAIHNNLSDLRQLLVSAEFGIPEDNCRVLTDPHDPKRVHAAIEEVVETVDPVSGAFLFYYAGHGRSHPSHGRLLLSMADTQEHQTYSYWSFDNLRDQIAESGLSTRLVILDSCYSGSALDLLAGLTDSSAAIRGTYVMTSSGATEPSTAPLGARNTDFTGQILATLISGIPGAGLVIDADALFETVRSHCLAHGLPVPTRQIRNDGSRIPLMPNRAHKTPLLV